MVHLAIAYQIHFQANRSLTPGFVLGSLAPDAIHMRPNTNREDKNRVHLSLNTLSEAEALAGVTALIDANQGGAHSFVQGYAAHILTDYYWLHEFARPFFEQIPAETTPEERRAWYYRETDQVDFNLYHQVPWRESVWELLAAAAAPEFPPYLSAAEIDGWRLRTLNWFHITKQEPGITPQIITDRVVTDFIHSAAQRVQTVLTRGDGQ
jgi:hypothetical protein